MIECLSSIYKQYKKDEYILMAGKSISHIGLVLNGSVHIVNEDFWGNRNILNNVEAGQIFGESYAFTPKEPLVVNVIAAENTDILFLDINRITTTCTSACSFHSRLINNLLSIISEKNLILTQKIEHISQKTIREKVLAYLSFQSKKQCKTTFDIPFNRQQMADYLSVDRSALSAELSNMKKENIISFHKNSFTIL